MHPKFPSTGTASALFSACQFDNSLRPLRTRPGPVLALRAPPIPDKFFLWLTGHPPFSFGFLFENMRHRCIQNSLLPVPIEYILVCTSWMQVEAQYRWNARSRRHKHPRKSSQGPVAYNVCSGCLYRHRLAPLPPEIAKTVISLLFRHLLLHVIRVGFSGVPTHLFIEIWHFQDLSTHIGSV